MLSSIQLTALRSAAAAAVAGERALGTPIAELTVAQWADESGWGQHQPGNNPFGIKADHGTPLATTEYVHSQECSMSCAFEVFATLDDAFKRHDELITTGKPYAAAWGQYQKDRQMFPLIERVAKVYATDPYYGVKLERLVMMPEIAAAIRDARQPLTTIANAK